MVKEADIAKALGEPTRLNILKYLYEYGSLSCVDISKITGKHRSTILRHLNVLVDAGLVRREGSLYSITDLGVKFLNLISTEGGAKIEIPIKRSKLFLFNRRSFLKLTLYCIACIPIAIGFLGLMAPVNVISRLVWLLLFLSLGLLIIFISRKL